MGSGEQPAHQVRYVQPVRFLTSRQQQCQDQSIPVGAFAGLIRKIGSRQTRGRTRLKALVHVVGTRTSDGTRYLRRLEHDLATRIMN